METGNFDSELNLPRPDDDAEGGGSDKDKDKKKKRKSEAGKAEAPDKEKSTDAASEAKEKDQSKFGVPESFGALLERMTRDLKPEDKPETKEGGGLSRLFKGEKEAEEKPLETKEAEARGEQPLERPEEQDPSLEHLTDTERREAAEVYIDDRQRDIAEEIEAAEPESSKSEAARAVEEFLEATRAKLRMPERTVDEAVDKSFEEVTQKYAPEAAAAATEARPAVEAANNELPASPATATEANPLPGAAETNEPADGDVIEEIDRSDVEHAMEYEDFVSPEADLPPVMAEGDTNPLLLSQEEETPPDVWGAPYQLYDTPMRVRHELIPDPVEAAVVPVPPFDHAVERELVKPEPEVPSVPVGTALVVGFAAYLFGRRRGRIRTEKRLLPIQKSLEREVRSIHEKLAAQETQLRRLVQQQASLLPLHAPSSAAGRSLEQGPAAAAAPVAGSERLALQPEPAIERPRTFEQPVPAIAIASAAATFERQPMAASTPEQPNRPAEPQPEPRRQPIESQPLAPTSRPEANVPLSAAESFSPPAMGQPAERAGSFMTYSPEVSRYEAPKPERANLPAEVAMMPREELVKAADEIVVGAATMRQVFETNLISERGLRRIVAEHRRGGDVRNVLTEELMLKEMGYERDPRVRDNPLSQQQMPRQTGGEAKTAASDPQPSTAGAPPVAAPVPFTVAAPSAAQPPATPPPLPPHLQPASYQAPAPAAPSAAPSTLVVANVVAIGILVVLLIILFVLHL